MKFTGSDDRLTLSFAPRTYTLQRSGRLSDVFLCRQEKVFHPNKAYVSIFSSLLLSRSPWPPDYWVLFLHIHTVGTGVTWHFVLGAVIDHVPLPCLSGLPGIKELNWMVTPSESRVLGNMCRKYLLSNSCTCTWAHHLCFHWRYFCLLPSGKCVPPNTHTHTHFRSLTYPSRWVWRLWQAFSKPGTFADLCGKGDARECS